ncbi:hypothetical protein PV325_001171 [Microctonus aethiopoides]|uniref:Biogenesis of lysosome-related organelles complex 1 subunit 6 n=1 Tax=Microctonus aethiopoides TaxID=144406 RepID=A0AA39FAT4_9HYME|nr:hypothetical protein PV325_001171 [Microctonus aethiopoides]KAK0166056.1 hypothetical protein PV328_004508 [Microctonus aethiopoides]
MMTDIGEAAAAEVQSNITSNEPEQLVAMTNATDKLVQGILDVYQSPLQQMKDELQELLKKQESLVDKMQVENKQLAETAEDEQCIEMYSTIKIYNDKLTRIKKEMTSIHERTLKLKKRALRLQQIKQKEALAKEHKREEETRREQELIGKPLSD